jgi:hypothetical protein
MLAWRAISFDETKDMSLVRADAFSQILITNRYAEE